MINFHTNPTAAIALGGGGARGVAHLGVIEMLQQLPVSIERYVGVSIGGLAGALCAADGDIRRVQKRVVDFLTSDTFQSKQAALFRAAPDAEEPATAGLFAWYHQIRKFLGAHRKLVQLFRRSSLLSSDMIRDIVDALLPDIDIRDTATPLSIVALDLYSGKQVTLTEGSLKDAVLASAAIPGVFPPVEWGSMLLCDIGMMDAIPAQVAKQYGKDLTIAVDVGGEAEPIDSCVTAADIFLRLSYVGEPLMRQYTIGIADVVIRPDVSRVPWYDFSSPADLIEKGREAVRTAHHLSGPVDARRLLSSTSEDFDV